MTDYINPEGWVLLPRLPSTSAQRRRRASSSSRMSECARAVWTTHDVLLNIARPTKLSSSRSHRRGQLYGLRNKKIADRITRYFSKETAGVYSIPTSFLAPDDGKGGVA